MKIKIGGGIVMLALFVLIGGYKYIDAENTVAWALAAATHEAGHFAAARLRRIAIKGITLDLIGAKMSLSGRIISYKDEAIIAAAGPMVNLILAGLFFPLFPNFFAFSLMLGILNLIPAPGFDGYRILFSLLSMYTGSLKPEKIMKALSFVAIFVLWLLAVYSLIKYKASFSLFILSCALFVRFLLKDDSNTA